MMDEHLLAALWLAELLGYGSEKAGELLTYYGSPLEIYRNRLEPELLSQLSTRQLDKMPELTLDTVKPMLAECERKGIRVLSWEDEAYPMALANLPDAPAALFVTGNVEALNRGPFVGMVGSRRPSAYGVRVCAELGGQMAKSGAVLVSGLADGLDSEAHKAAVKAEMPTVAVLGTAIDVTYPVTNTNLRSQMEALGGAVISEYGPGRASGKNLFLLRNRLIAGLSDALCVVEARRKSGTLSTVHHAQRYGKPVYAVPGNLFSPLSEGTNDLIATGEAKILRDAETLLRDLGLAAAKQETDHKPVIKLSATARQLMAVLGDKPVSLDAVCAVSGLPTGQVLAAITELELAGQVTALPGRQYALR